MGVGCIRGASIFVVTFASLCNRFEALPWAWAGVSSSRLYAVGDTLSAGVCCLVVSLIWVCVEEVACFRPFRVIFVLCLIDPELLGAAELRCGGELKLVFRLCVVEASLILFASSVCWGWFDEVGIGCVDWLEGG